MTNSREMEIENKPMNDSEKWTDDKDDKMELDILKKATEIVKKAWASTSGI